MKHSYWALITTANTFDFVENRTLSVNFLLFDILGSLNKGVLSDARNVVNVDRFIFCFQVTIQGEWVLWQSKVPQIEVETHKVAAPDVVVPTVDTVRHEALLYTWLAEHKPMVLCGPPGSGKTMTLFSALRALPDMEVCNRPLPSSKNPHFQNEAKCTTVVVKMSFICMSIEKHFHIKGWALNLVLI